MSSFRCVYCSTEFPVQPLPCTCPGCERTLRVSSHGGGTVEEMMLIEDRRWLDLMDKFVDTVGNLEELAKDGESPHFVDVQMPQPPATVDAAADKAVGTLMRAVEALVGDSMRSTYEIVEDGKAIKCLICERTSWNPNDVSQRYCGCCRAYHSDMQMEREYAALDEENDDGEE